MANRFDVIIVGSGFGGAVCACRLAEKGMSVLVLERGRRWTVAEYPSQTGKSWIYDIDEPEKQDGWADIRFFPNMIVAQGAGVGGGSLIYANISVEAPRFVFDDGWPPEITYSELQPHYETVGRMLDVQELPDNQLTERFKLMREGAEKVGASDRFTKLPLAVTFDPEWNYDLGDRFNPARSKTFVNAHGKKQGTCVHLGDCDIGCEVQAKNTLDLNYIAEAEKHGAEVRPRHVVDTVERENSGYRVHFRRIEDGRVIPGSEAADRVVIAAGSLGSTEILLRCRDQYKTLTRISRELGKGWSSNADFLTPAFYDDRSINPSQGPTITSAIDFLDRSVDDERFFIEDGGFPDVLRNYLEQRVKRRARLGYGTVLRKLRKLRKDRENRPFFSGTMPWFAQGIDAADGVLHLGRKWHAPWKRRLKLKWKIKESEGVIDAIVAMHKRLSRETGGRPWVPPTWEILENLVTPHPLGGCIMGTDTGNGVVDHTGEIFGYERLYVVDGAVIPKAIGRNPSRTIAALAERSAGLMR